jgi:hypothetical protein
MKAHDQSAGRYGETVSVLYTAHAGSYEDFLEEYVSSDATKLFAGGRPLLFKSVTNPDITARVAITTQLLNDGADASVTSGGINVLHALFGCREHDAEYEAPMLRRLIDGRANVNLVSKRFGPPLAVLIKQGPSPESARAPFYDVLFERPNLDLSVRCEGGTLRDLIFNSAWNLPLLRDRALAYEPERN